MSKNKFCYGIKKEYIKKVTVGFMLMLIVIINIGCSKNTIELNTSETNKEIISNNLFEKYLDEYLDENVSDKSRLIEYKITGIKVKEEKEDGFKFLVLYEIKPYNWDKYKMSEKERQSWEESKIVYSHAYVDIENSGSTYKIINVDTKQVLDKNGVD